MDEMNIKSNFTKDLIAKAICKIVKSKLGIEAKLDLGDLVVRIGDTDAIVMLSLGATVPKSELPKIMSKVL